MERRRIYSYFCHSLQITRFISTDNQKNIIEILNFIPFEQFVLFTFGFSLLNKTSLIRFTVEQKMPNKMPFIYLKTNQNSSKS